MSERLQNIKLDAQRLTSAIQALDDEMPSTTSLDDFGQLFSTIRKARGISMDDACQITGLSDKTIRKIEREPSALKTAKLESIQKMATMIGVSLCVIT